MSNEHKYTKWDLLKALQDKEDQAKKYLDDENVIESLLQDFEAKRHQIPGIEAIENDLDAVTSMVRAYVKKEFTDASPNTILLCVAAAMYVVDPENLVPDEEENGLEDDGAAVQMIYNTIRSDLQKYIKWRNEKTAQDG